MSELERSGSRGPAARLAAATRRIDGSEGLLSAVRRLRARLPGDERFGDPLSIAGDELPQTLARRVAEATAERPGALREAGLTALQLWQALSEAQGRGRGDAEMTIVFTDLVEFSRWALDAGDDAALRLLRDVGEAIEPAFADAGGRVVKRLGDGVMAAFPDPPAALAGLVEASARLRTVEVDGHRPRMRAGMHAGRPRRLGGDLLGVDVNVAARLCEQASADEVLVSGEALAELDGEALGARRKRRFKVKGVPKELTSHSVRLCV